MCYSKEDSNSRVLKIQCVKRYLRTHPTIKQLLDMQQYISALKSFNVCQGEKSTDKTYELRKQWLSLIDHFIPMEKTRLRQEDIINGYI